MQAPVADGLVDGLVAADALEEVGEGLFVHFVLFCFVLFYVAFSLRFVFCVLCFAFCVLLWMDGCGLCVCFDQNH